MRAVALILEPRPAAAGEIGERRKDPGELDADLVIERREAAWFEPGGVLVECIHEEPEGQVELELGRAPGKHDTAARVAAPRQLSQQPGLADPRLADQHERHRFTALEPGDGAVQRTQLRGAPNEVLNDLGQRGVPFAPTIAGSVIATQPRVANQGLPPMPGEAIAGTLVTCPASWSITGTNRTSAESPSPPSRATTARSATTRRCPRARPAAMRSGGRSKPPRSRTRCCCCRSSSPSAQRSHGSARSRSREPPE